MTKKEAIRQTEQENVLLSLGFTRDEAEQLRRISNTLQHWFEKECGDGNEYGSWAIVRGRMVKSADKPQPWRQHVCSNGHTWRAAVVLSRETSNLSGEISQLCPECFDRARESQPWTLEDGSPYPFNGKPVFQYDDDGEPYMEHRHYRHGHGKDTVSYTRLPDREMGARKRLAAIVAARNSRPSDAQNTFDVSAYIQTDPRGAALYIIRPGDVPEGQDVSAWYSRGICVY